jgi:quinol-cytochrome oxidoreductase complex cytochrome b subunit
MMVVAIFIWLALPFLDTSVVRSAFFKPVHLFNFVWFVMVAFALGWIGQEVVEYPFINFSVLITISYFMYYFGHVFYTKFFEKL